MAGLGATALRLYHPPPRWLLDDALEAGLRVLIDVPWEKHRCFLEDWSSQRDAIDRVRQTAAELGNHPAVLGISVANEIPKDVVRFYGARRIERFIGQLLDTVKQEASDCLTSYTNYPTTEFLNPEPLDFMAFNVYLENGEALGDYLDRLQHLAGPLPLILGECGLDAYRKGEAAQAEGLRMMLAESYRRGLCGAFVFSYTDEWFTGGHLVEDWAFGITDRDRREKPAARAVSRIWAQAPRIHEQALPRISAVVCAYNGAATLEECLRSLVALDYPDYEVILVDDGSTDQTARIAANYPSIRYVHQTNKGLSAARNVGARLATGQIVAYTDCDCVADPQWLFYLAVAMRDKQVDAIGGPNLPPACDNWVAKCVAASPGGPSHVMLDDRLAEHVPGCNMAFSREKLLDIGGFDDQFRVAGDDVDICWRFLDAGLKIGFAPSALVWHHRRNTVKAYLKQQRGYGRAEAMLQCKHPQRFNSAGAARWNGIIYGEGAVGLPLRPTPVYYGKFGTSPFQIIYRHNSYSAWGYFTLLEWHALAALLLIAAAAWPPMAFAAGIMWLLSIASVARLTWSAPLPRNAPRWCRGLVFLLHLSQPVVRAISRHAHRILQARQSRRSSAVPPGDEQVKWLSAFQCDLYWQSTRDGRGREQLLDELVAKARQRRWRGIYGEEWSDWDVLLTGDCWTGAVIHTATEELGGPRRFTRVRCTLRPTQEAIGAAAAVLLWNAVALIGGRQWAMLAGVLLWAILLVLLLRSGWSCIRAVTALLREAGEAARLEPVMVKPAPRAAARNTREVPVGIAEPASVFPGETV